MADTTVFDEQLTGWWWDLELADLDNDGDLDVIAGNIGLNNKFHPSAEKPLEIYMGDLDATGTNDIVLAKHKAPGSTECVPVRGRECSSEQMPFIKEKFKTYKAFSEADLTTLYGDEQLRKAVHLSARDFRSMVWRNNGGNFTPVPLPSKWIAIKATSSRGMLTPRASLMFAAIWKAAAYSRVPSSF